MAQKSNKRQPVYSADTLALRYLFGLMLVALGVIMFLAVALHLTGNVFDALRRVCYGVTGGLAVLLPALPVWGGVLVIWSAQRKPPVKPFVYAALAYVGLCALIVLVTRIGNEEFLGHLSRTGDGSWGGTILQGYQQSARLGASGGALGVILAFPFWNLTGTILSVVLVVLLVIVCLLMALNLTPARIRELATGKARLGFRRNRENPEAQDQRQIQFQQEQERQRQMAYAQQQAYILQQQAAQTAAQTAARPVTPVPGNTGRQPAWTGTNPAMTNQSILEWQQQLSHTPDGNARERKSSIFDRKRPAEEAGQSMIFDRPAGQETPGTDPGFGRRNGAENRVSQIFDAPAAQEPRKTGGIFGRRKAQEDGLSDLSPEEKRQEGMAYPGLDRMRAQQTRRPAEPAQPQVQPAAAGAETLFQDAGAEGIRKNKTRIRQEEIEEDLARWNQPAEKAAEATVRPSEAGKETPRREEPRREEPVREKPGEAREQQTGVAGRWKDQLLAAEQASRETAEGKERHAAKADGGTRAPETAPTPVPVVQETIADPTWKPELKRVETKEKTQEEEYWEPTPYYAPPITDLKKPDAAVLDTSAEDQQRSLRLEQTLGNFKVQARVVNVTHGPAISRFELELAPGTKVGKVAELERDIAYGMEATSVRIEAPIPGKSLVGVEVPNPQRATVTLREVLESPQMQNAKSILTVALGKDIAGTPIVCDLAKMPHMLIAGATGSGKSVCINTIINSLLFRAGPDEVKLILVDPKVVELQCYNGIPHLLLPVVNDPHKASAALAWAVAEMMERYDKFSERGVRQLDGYNRTLEPGEKPMPRIVIIIDELADLMMVCKKDVEEYICRITQLARAAGIHLIVATQRPSVDVITGLIKANIPSRIAFKTASSVDSRTILDRNGSEQLLGWGDMLYLPTGSFTPTRVQGCFLSDEEVNRIAEHVRQANPSSYDPDVLDKLEQLSKSSEDGPGMDMIGGAPDNGPGDADLFAQAVEYAIADGQISTSTLQRRLKVGYARAGRLTDEMEERGIVSAKDGSKPRKCLITREQWEAMRESAQ